ncbi:sensor histidine kinase [hydrothermal vent metagenome]|uniref:histidine kinase n=1 Tax=hydrothermal vent metagenome TaxID=652676 RepID=A0A1W1D5F0_9ZZZZ
MEKFNSDVSHELKTPLTVIQGEIELILRQLHQPKEYEKALKTIQKQSKQIELIVKQLLLLTKYSKENIQKTFEECSLDSLLLNSVEKFESKLKEKNLHLQIDKIEPITIQANPILISAIFDNLIDNAIKYTPKEKNITISLYQNETINFIITDKGIGIEEKHLAKITQRFYRVDEARSKKIEGVGLGLSIVQNSVYLHGGKLNINSQLEKGTKVIVNF